MTNRVIKKVISAHMSEESLTLNEKIGGIKKKFRQRSAMNGNNDRGDKVPRRDWQYYNDQIKEGGYGEIQPQPIADERGQSYQKSAGDSPNAGPPEPMVLDSLHAEYSLADFRPRQPGAARRAQTRAQANQQGTQYQLRSKSIPTFVVNTKWHKC
jgi:hypothetical protein